MRREKITVVGAGNVGATTAQRLAERDYADVVLVDIVEGLPQGKALDMNEAGPVVGYESTVVGLQRLRGDRRLVDLRDHLRPRPHAGDEPRRPAQDQPGDRRRRDQEPRAALARDDPDRGHQPARRHVPGGVQHRFDFPRERVIGMAGVLDTARFRTFLAWELGVSVSDVTGFVLGGHGDQMVPVTSNTNIAGIPVTDLIEPDRLDEIVQRTRDGGAEVVKLLKSGSAYYAPSAAICEMVDSIVLDQKRVLPARGTAPGRVRAQRPLHGSSLPAGRPRARARLRGRANQR